MAKTKKTGTDGGARTSGALARRLSSLARVSSERPVKFEWAADGSGAATDGNVIHVPAAALPNVQNRVEDLLVKKHMVVHEAAHVKFTDQAAWRAMVGRAQALPTDRGRILRDLANIVEDAAVELAMANDRPGTAALIQWSNQKVSELRPEPGQRLADEGGAAALIEAVAQKAIVGRVRGAVPAEIEREYQECLPLIEKGRYAAVTADRMAVAEELFRRVERLLEQGSPPPAGCTVNDHSDNAGSARAAKSNPQAEFQPPDPGEAQEQRQDGGGESPPSDKEESGEGAGSEQQEPDPGSSVSEKGTADTGDGVSGSEDERPESQDNKEGAGKQDGERGGAGSEPKRGDESGPPGDTGDGGGTRSVTRLSLDFDSLLDEAAAEISQIDHEEKGEVPRYRTTPRRRITRSVQGDPALYRNVAAEVAPIARCLDAVFERYFPRRNSRMTNSARGRVNPAKLWHDADPRYRSLFEHRERPKKLELAVCVLLDCSASMLADVWIGSDKTTYFDCARNAAVMLHEVLKRRHIPHTVIGHTAGRHIELYPFVTGERPDGWATLGVTVRDIRMDMNADGAVIRDHTVKLLKYPQRHRVLFVVSDGEPSVSETSLIPLEDTKVAVAEAERAGVTVIGISIGQDHGYMEELYQNRVCVDSPATLPSRMAELLARLCARWANS